MLPYPGAACAGAFRELCIDTDLIISARAQRPSKALSDHTAQLHNE